MDHGDNIGLEQVRPVGVLVGGCMVSEQFWDWGEGGCRFWGSPERGRVGNSVGLETT